MNEHLSCFQVRESKQRNWKLLTLLLDGSGRGFARVSTVGVFACVSSKCIHVHVYTQLSQRSCVRLVPSVIHHTFSEQQALNLKVPEKTYLVKVGELGKHGR